MPYRPNLLVLIMPAVHTLPIHLPSTQALPALPLALTHPAYIYPLPTTLPRCSVSCPAFHLPADLFVKHEQLVFAAASAMELQQPLLDILLRCALVQAAVCNGSWAGDGPCTSPHHLSAHAACPDVWNAIFCALPAPLTQGSRAPAEHEQQPAVQCAAPPRREAVGGAVCALGAGRAR